MRANIRRHPASADLARFALARFALAGLALTLGAGAAPAGERIVMPYRCDVTQGRLQLVPTDGRPVAHAVVGQREEMPFAVCAGFGNPECPPVAVYKMVVQCGAAQVPWVEVASRLLAASAVPSRIDQGSLVIQPPGRPPGQPQAEPVRRERCQPRHHPVAPFHLGHRVATEELCAAAEPAREVVLPKGFAPLVELGARLAGVDPEPPPPERASRRADANVAVAQAEAADVALPASTVLALRASRDRAVETAPLPEIAAQPTAAPGLATPVQVADGRLPHDAAKVAGSGAASGREALVDGGVGQPAPTGRERVERLVMLVRPEGPWGVMLAGLVTTSVAVVWAVHAVRSRRRLPAPVFASAELLPLVQTLSPGLLEGVPQVEALCDLTSQSIAALDAAPPLQEVLDGEVRQARLRLAAAISGAGTGADGPRRAAAMCRNIVRDLDRIRRIADSAAVSFRGTQTRIVPPATRAEAYEVLGINPDVGDATLKKLADALRMSWHPDHARDEADRLRREARTKQINIALDMIRAGREANAA